MTRSRSGTGGSPVKPKKGVQQPPELEAALESVRLAQEAKEAERVESARRRAQARAIKRKQEFEKRQRQEAARKELERAKKWVERDRRLSTFLSRQAAKVPCAGVRCVATEWRVRVLFFLHKAHLRVVSCAELAATWQCGG